MAQENDSRVSQKPEEKKPGSFKRSPKIEDPKKSQEPDEYEMKTEDKKIDNPYHELQMEEEMGVDQDQQNENSSSEEDSRH